MLTKPVIGYLMIGLSVFSYIFAIIKYIPIRKERRFLAVSWLDRRRIPVYAGLLLFIIFTHIGVTLIATELDEDGYSPFVSIAHMSNWESPTVALRAEPQEDANVIGTLHRYERFRKGVTVDGWVNIRIVRTSQEGWVPEALFIRPTSDQIASTLLGILREMFSQIKLKDMLVDTIITVAFVSIFSFSIPKERIENDLTTIEFITFTMNWLGFCLLHLFKNPHLLSYDHLGESVGELLNIAFIVGLPSLLSGAISDIILGQRIKRWFILKDSLAIIALYLLGWLNLGLITGWWHF